MPTCMFTKKSLSNILHHVFCLHFLRTHYDYFFRRGFQNVQVQFLSGNISKKLVLLVIYLFNCNSSKSTFFMLNMAFDVVLSTVFVKYIGILRFLQYKDYKNIFLVAQIACFDMYFLKKLNCSLSW